MARPADSFKKAIGSAGVTLILLLAAAVPAQAANVYPDGGSSFSGNSEGWVVKSASCNVALCTAGGGHDAANGNPPGSLAADTNIGLNLLGLFQSTVVLQSPDFKVSGGETATLQLDRQFTQGDLVDLAPQARYTVSLIDQNNFAESKPTTETLAATPFGTKKASVTVTPGHTYAISITVETSSTIAGVGLLSGNTSTRFDNVALLVQEPGDGNGGGNGKGRGGNGGGGDSISDSQLLSLVRSSAEGPAVLKGKRLFVKAPCPATVGRNCRLSLQGLLHKRKPATTKRTSKVAKGRTKTLALKVKPKARQKLAKSNRILFRVKVRAGKAQATVYKRLKLIRRR